MNLFYSPHIEGDTFELDKKESKHAVRVLRLGVGDAVQLVDGKGGWFDAVIEDDNPVKCRMKITAHSPDHKPLPYSLHLAVSPTKNMDRYEWFLEKATEIGITEITPLMCHRTERKQVKPERLERILVSAMKQSLRAYKPVLHEATSLAEFMGKEYPDTKGVAHLG
ncbi:MAG: 16S rRNA (uracil(1498)-N(3))-methyltransferase, partial [Bacteroidales bacterium]|nr:16S rRNA (uracil(1498)-N(3))-methyltransferase [Bacteroidales bacterium]